MKKVLFLISVLTLINCGGDDDEITFELGLPGLQGPSGKPGKAGSDGSDGADGTDGYSAAIQIVDVNSCGNINGYTILTSIDVNRNGYPDALDVNFQTAQICNGIDGEDGNDGENGENGEDGENGSDASFSIADLYDPCGDKAGVIDEVFITLSDGNSPRYLASFSSNVNGAYTRFALLTAGSYMTTDTSNCYFTILSDGSIANEHY